VREESVLLTVPSYETLPAIETKTSGRIKKIRLIFICPHTKFNSATAVSRGALKKWIIDTLMNLNIHEEEGTGTQLRDVRGVASQQTMVTDSVWGVCLDVTTAPLLVEELEISIHS